MAWLSLNHSRKPNFPQDTNPGDSPTRNGCGRPCVSLHFHTKFDCDSSLLVLSHQGRERTCRRWFSSGFNFPESQKKVPGFPSAVSFNFNRNTRGNVKAFKHGSTSKLVGHESSKVVGSESPANSAAHFGVPSSMNAPRPSRLKAFVGCRFFPQARDQAARSEQPGARQNWWIPSGCPPFNKNPSLRGPPKNGIEKGKRPEEPGMFRPPH